MPAESKNQATAARIAKAAKQGKIPMNKLKGASKEMAKGMSTKELKKFSKAKPGAPKKVAKESLSFHDIYVALLAENAEPIVETTINDIADKMAFVCEHLKSPFTRDKAMTILRHLGRKMVELNESKKKKVVVKKRGEDEEFNAKKADRNKDGEVSEWERKVGEKVAAAKK